MAPTRLDSLLALHARAPQDSFCSYAIALEHVKSGDCEGAIGWFDRSIGADPSAPYTHYHRACALEALGREAEAVESARRALAAALAAQDAHAAAEARSLLARFGAVA